MSTRPPRLDRTAAELLLDGAVAGVPGSPEPVAGLLADAAGPGRPAELTGEYAAIVAFRAAQLAGTRAAEPAGAVAAFPPPARRRGSAARRLLTAKAAAVLAATVVGSVAVAAGTGKLPGPWSPDMHTTPPAPTSSPTAPPTVGTGTVGPGGPGGSPGPGTGAPVAQEQLCRQFLAMAADNRGQALNDPAFAPLIRAAGGRGRVTSYCTELVAAAPTAPQPSTPEPTGQQPTDHPTGEPPSHPTGKPTAHPTPSHPTPSHPTGRPSPHPTPPHSTPPHPTGRPVSVD